MIAARGHVAGRLEIATPHVQDRLVLEGPKIRQKQLPLISQDFTARTDTAAQFRVLAITEIPEQGIVEPLPAQFA